MFQDPKVAATLGGPLSDSDVDRTLERSLHHWDRHGFGNWTFFLKSDETQFVGRTGLRHAEVDEQEEIELAYAIVADQWNQGFATEMSLEVLSIGFRTLNLRDVVCFTLPTNMASQRVMAKVGFVSEKNIIHADLPHVLCRMTKQRFVELYPCAMQV
jgi:RimJ/RimL family protein N-acetyltransferase